MQNAKNSFYVALRARLAVLNPARQITLNGVTRPGILVEENEVYAEQPPMGVFVLRWEGTGVNTSLPAMLESQTCTVFYATKGTETALEMDRGAVMTEMDAELASILQPQSAQKVNVTATGTTAMATNIFWTDAVFGAVLRTRERLSRSVTVTVYDQQEILPSGALEL